VLSTQIGLEKTRMTTNSDDVLVQIRWNVGRVLHAEAFDAWYDTPIPALQGRTPRECIDSGDADSVLRLSESYLDPSFS
jgi:hypothetical protein